MKRKIKEVTWEEFKAEVRRENSSLGSLGRSMYYASVFLSMLPDDVPAPEVYDTLLGTVELEWYSSLSCLFTVEFEKDGTITYAGRCGEEEEGGEIKWDQVDSKLEFLVSRIRRVVEEAERNGNS